MGILTSLSKSATSAALHVSEIVLLLFGVVLVVGLIGEYAESERWKKWVKLFEMMVIIGVAGELLADGGIFLFSRQLEAISEVEIAGLNKEAGEARRTAGEANERAANVERHAAQLAKNAEDERLERVKLQEKMAWRKLTPEQAKRIVDKLKPFSGTPYDLYANPDPESLNFLETVDTVLHSAGWVKKPNQSSGQFSNGAAAIFISRLVISVAPSQVAEFGNAANAVAAAFLAEHIDAIAGADANHKMLNVIHVEVGAKP